MMTRFYEHAYNLRDPKVNVVIIVNGKGQESDQGLQGYLVLPVSKGLDFLKSRKIFEE